MKTPSHFSVVGGFLMHPTARKYKKQWIKIIWGASWKYLRADHLQKLWYFRHAAPTHKKTYPITHSAGPALAVTHSREQSPEHPHLPWMFWLDANGEISYTRGADGVLPTNAPLDVQSLGATALLPPSLSADSQHLYVAYVDPDHRIRLKAYSIKHESWQDILFPEHVATDERPAVCGGLGDWLTVAYRDAPTGDLHMIGTNRDWARSGASPWPSQGPFYQSSDTFWRVVETWADPTNITMVRYRQQTWLMYRQAAADRDVFWVSNPDGQESCYLPLTGPLPSGAPSLCVSNDTLFVAHAPPSGRISIDVLPPRWTMTDQGTVTLSHVAVEPAAWLEETAHTDPSLSFVWKGSGSHPYPVLVVGWSGTDASRHLNLRGLNIDTKNHPTAYQGRP